MFSRRVRIILLLVLAAAALLFLWWVRAVLAPFILALVLVYALGPAVGVLERRMPRWAAVAAVYAGLILAVWAGLAFVIPSLLQEINGLAGQLPLGIARLQEWLQAGRAAYDRVYLPEFLRAGLARAGQVLEDRFPIMVGESVAGIGSLLRFLLDLLLAPFLAYYLLIDRHALKERLLEQMPPFCRNEVDLYLLELDRVAAGFIRGQLLISLLIGVMTAAALALIGIPYAVLLGLLAGALEVVPYFGPPLAWLPAFVLGLFQGPSTFFAVLLAFVLIHQIDAAVLAPRIMANSIGLHPLTVVFSLLAGGQSLGMAGILLALPAAAAIKVTLAFGYRLLVRYPPAG